MLARPLLATVLLSAIATAQQSSSYATTLKVTSGIVILDVDVVNKKTHSLVNNLTVNDFTILEDKIPQTIRSFDRPSSHKQSLTWQSISGTREKTEVTILSLGTTVTTSFSGTSPTN